MKSLMLVFTLLSLSMTFTLVGCGKAKNRAKVKKVEKVKATKSQAQAVARKVAPVFEAIGKFSEKDNPVKFMQRMQDSVFKAWSDSKAITKQKSSEVIKVSNQSEPTDQSWSVLIEMSNNQKIQITAPLSGSAATVSDANCEAAKQQANTNRPKPVKGRPTPRAKPVKCDAYAAAANCIDEKKQDKCKNHLLLVSVTPATKTSDNAPYLLSFFYSTARVENVKSQIHLPVALSLSRQLDEKLNVKSGHVTADKFTYHYQALLFNNKLQATEFSDLVKDPVSGNEKNYMDDSADKLTITPKTTAGADPANGENSDSQKPAADAKPVAKK